MASTCNDSADLIARLRESCGITGQILDKWVLLGLRVAEKWLQTASPMRKFCLLQSRPTSVLTSCFRRGVTPDFLESDRTRLRAPNEESESQESTPMKESTLLG